MPQSLKPQKCVNPVCRRILTKRKDRKEKRKDGLGRWWCIKCYSSFRLSSPESASPEGCPISIPGSSSTSGQSPSIVASIPGPSALTEFPDSLHNTSENPVDMETILRASSHDNIQQEHTASCEPPRGHEELQLAATTASNQQKCANPVCGRILTKRQNRKEKRKDGLGRWWCIKCYSSFRLSSPESASPEECPISIPGSSSTSGQSPSIVAPIPGPSALTEFPDSLHNTSENPVDMETILRASSHDNIQQEHTASCEPPRGHEELQLAATTASNQQKCANPVCGRILTKRQNRKEKRKDGLGRWWCILCFRQMSRQGNQNPDEDVQERLGSSQDVSQPVFQIRVPRIAAPHHSCIFKCTNAVNLVAVPKRARLEALYEKQIYIPDRTSCCARHIAIDNCLDDEALTILECIVYEENSTMNTTQMESIMFGFMDIIGEMRGAVNVSRFSDKKFLLELGISRDDFETILRECNVPEWKSNYIAVYINQLYTNDSQQRLAENWKVSQSSISRRIREARRELIGNFVPHHLGETHITRELIKENTTQISMRLYNVSEENIITVWDGTYLYLTKSQNYSFQKQTWSQQKLRNLNKPMMVSTTNGYIIKAFEFFPPGVNDAEALRQIMNTRWFRRFFREGDVFVVDRGFRDVKQRLENEGFVVYMPSFLQRNDSQLSDISANRSRLCTMIRWVIEAVNQKIKRFKYIAQTRLTIDQKHLYLDLQVVCAIENAFGTRLISHHNNLEVAERALALVSRRNLLQSLVKPLITKKQGYFARLEEYEGIVPLLTEEELHQLGGVYHLKQARSYYAVTRMSGNENRGFQVLRERIQMDYESVGIQIDDPLLIRGQVKSRFYSQKTHTIFVLFDKAETGASSVKHAYCTCRAGARVLDFCVHIMVIVWYLCYARYLPRIIDPASYLNELCPSGVLDQSETDTDEDW